MLGERLSPSKNGQWLSPSKSGQLLSPSKSPQLLNSELQEERRKRQELLRFAQEGEAAAQETLSDLACERTLRIKADARIIQLEDRIDDRERSLDDAFIELRDLRERLFAKDLHIHDLEESLKSAESKVKELRAEATQEQSAFSMRLAQLRAEATQEQSAFSTRLAQAEKSSADAAESKAEQLAKVELQLEHALDDLAEECDLRMQSDTRIDELDASLNAHGREMDVIALEFKALQDGVSARDRSICELHDRLKAVEHTAAIHEKKALANAVEKESTKVWEERCAGLREVLCQVETEAQRGAAANAERMFKLEAKEMQLKTELQSSVLKAPALESQKFSLAVAESEMSHFQKDADNCRQEVSELRSELLACRSQTTWPNATLDRSKLRDNERIRSNFPASATPEKEITSLRTEMLHLKTDAGACRHEMAELRAELMASRGEPRICQEKPTDQRLDGFYNTSVGAIGQSELASFQSECLRLRRERDRYVRDLDDQVRELTRIKRHMQTLECRNDLLEDRLTMLDRHDRPQHPQLELFATPERHSQRRADAMDVDIAIHAAALNVAVRAELDAARKGEEQVAQAALKDALNARNYDINQADDRNQVLQDGSEMRIWNLASELQAEKAFSVEAANALQDSMRALREQEQLADGLRSKLDMATTSCAAARVARASATKRSQRNIKVLAVEAPGRATSKPLYRNSSTPDRYSNLRSRIEEEARLRMSLGLTGLTA